jgi:hypothetical protein
MVAFNFYFYDLPSSFGHPTRIRRGLGASDGPSGRYATYFHALAMSITKDNAEETVAAILEVERGQLPLHEFGADGWIIHVTQRGVVFENEDYEDINNEELGAFTFAELKWVLMAWWEFLLLPDLSGGSQYTFTLPIDTPCLLDKPDSLLNPVVGAGH